MKQRLLLIELLKVLIFPYTYSNFVPRTNALPVPSGNYRAKLAFISEF